MIMYPESLKCSSFQHILLKLHIRGVLSKNYKLWFGVFHFMTNASHWVKPSQSLLQNGTCLDQVEPLWISFDIWKVFIQLVHTSVLLVVQTASLHENGTVLGSIRCRWTVVLQSFLECSITINIASWSLAIRNLPLTANNLPKIWKNQEKNREKEDKSGRKGKNQEVSFTLPLLTDRAGYATEDV